MQIHKIEIVIFDFDDYGVADFINSIEFAVTVLNKQTKEISDWSDDHPLNHLNNEQAIHEIFKNKENKMKIETKYNTGDKVEDNVTGFKGIVMGITRYATGCLHYGVCPTKLDKDGKEGDWSWFDESRLILKKKDAVKFNIPEFTTSGPTQNAPQNEYN